MAYRLDKNGDGSIRACTRTSGQGGADVDLTDEDEICAALESICKHNPQSMSREFNISDGDDFQFFCREEKLIAYRKRHAFMLSVEDPFSQGGVTQLAPADFVGSTGGYGRALGIGSDSFFRIQSPSPKTTKQEGESPSWEGISRQAFITNRLRESINSAIADSIRGQRDSELAKIAMYQIERTVVYLDISDFSKMKPYVQALAINTLVAILNDDRHWKDRGLNDIGLESRAACEASLCIGDGYIFVFRKPENAVYFAAYLASIIEKLNAAKSLHPEFHYRMSVNTGMVFRFWDRTGNPRNYDPGRWNFIGDGITGGERLLSSPASKEKDDVVYVSAETRLKLIEAKITADKIQLINRGRFKDKHDQFRRVYELDHMSITNTLRPKLGEL